MENDIISLLGDLDAKAARIRYGASKRLMLLSKSNPAELYPFWDRFVELLESSYQILRWNASRILANLVVADSQRKFDRLFSRFFAPIAGPVMITAANIIGASPAVVRARPDLLERVLDEILGVSKARYQTPTCRDIAIGHALVALAQFPLGDAQKKRVLRFAKSHLDNSRRATGVKAQKLIKLLEPQRGKVSPRACR